MEVRAVPRGGAACVDGAGGMKTAVLLDRATKNVKFSLPTEWSICRQALSVARLFFVME